MKCLSTATSNQHSFTVSYLINSCGFSQKAALSASKCVNFNSPENADSVFAFLKSYGFSETQISMLIRRCPKVLGASPERTLLPKFEFFYSKGFSSPELVKISSVCPEILFRSLENHIIPTFNYLIDLFKSSETVVNLVKQAPYILRHDVETYIEPSINVLRDIGVPEQNIIMFLRFWSRPTKTRLSALKNTVEAVKEMGFNPLRSQFILAVVAKGHGKINWESKVEIYRRWGWSEEEFLSAFQKSPLCMMASDDKIMAIMDFLVNKMDMESSAIAKRPDIIVHSMGKTFIPRGAVYHFLLSKGLIKRKDTNLISLFKDSEKSFLRKFVNSYEEAPQLLKIYQEKLGISKMTKTSVSRERDNVIVK
ncbi:hypothetical protein LWI29_014212 [Acer saccharum]|uniref:Uncharacterized protein n=1 Tax=Acer saccharum TaxID=4024 RepID=A0AA39W2G6_ACESA|nr:hypothetical protein LWI29_014212 [Acer saccharum]